MSLQHRPLTGMQVTPTANGATPPLLVPTAAPTVIHQVDATQSPTNFLDQVTLFLLNAGAADQSITMVVMGVSMVVTVPAGEIVRVFADQPFYGVAGNTAASQITVRNTTGQPENVFAYGFFTR